MNLCLLPPATQTEILSLPETCAIESEWWDLWRRDPHATPFQSPAWLLPWRRQFSGGADVVLTLRERGRLIGLLPLYCHDGRLLPWGAGTTDRLGGVFDPALDREVLSRALALPGLPVDLFQLCSGSPLLATPAPPGWRAEGGPAESCAVLHAPMQAGRKMAQNLRYYRRRADRAGVGPARPGDPAELPEMIGLHTRRWRGRGEAGIFGDPRVERHLREALPLLQKAGLARLYLLEIGAEAVAALFVLTAKKQSFYYIGGFDPDHAALGLGTILVGHAIEEARRESHMSFDFLRGSEAYKYRWGARDEPTYARRFCPPGQGDAS